MKKVNDKPTLSVDTPLNVRKPVSTSEFRDVVIKNIRYTLFQPAYTEDLFKCFSNIWLKQNVLYVHMEISKEQLRTYYDLLVKRALVQPWTCLVAIEESQSSPLYGEVVGFYFAEDFYDDPVAEEMKTLCDELQIIFKFNEEITNSLRHCPFLRHVKGVSRKISFACHMGAYPEYGKKKVAGTGMALICRHHMNLGFHYFAGVLTHPSTIKSSVQRIPNSYYDFVLTWQKIDEWKYQGIYPFRGIDSEIPYALLQMGEWSHSYYDHLVKGKSLLVPNLVSSL